MVRYEVIVEARPDLAGRFEQYMRGRHIPEILATGCFSEIRFQRADGGRFRTSYLAASRDDVDRYLQQHTAAFRADFRRHFPDGVSTEREIWTDLEVWDR